MRFATQLLLWQLACVIAVVAVCAAVFTWLGVQQLRAEAESSALSIARTIANDTDVRTQVEGYSRSPGAPGADELRNGSLAALAKEVEQSTGALFVVITDDHGIRLAHPDPERLGEQVSTSYAEALAGRETVSWESGTLGESARAKVPVFAPGTGAPVGEVSVGFARESVFHDLPPLLAGVGIAAAAALAIGALVSVLIRRRLERLTLGVQPEELVALVQNQAAVLDGVGEGVIAYTPAGRVTVANASAARILRAADLVGSDIRTIRVADAMRDALAGSTEVARDPAEPIVTADRVVFVDTQRVRRGDRDLGVVAVIRDRTDVVAMSERLESFSAMTNALRAQRHEFSNRLHVTAGLIDARRVADARSYLDQVLAVTSSVAAPGGRVPIDEPFLRSLVEAKAIEAAERGVRLRLGEDSLVLGRVVLPEDVASVLGNLVDNAVRAAVEGDEPREVVVDLLDDGDTLALTVSDSGRGVAHPDVLFDGESRDQEAIDPDDVHGRGVGLPLARRIARRLGGDLWLVESGGAVGGASSGAVFSARLPGAMIGDGVGPRPAKGVRQ